MSVSRYTHSSRTISETAVVCEGHTRTLRHCCIRHTQTNIKTTQATHANCRAVDAGTRKSSVRRGVDRHHGIMIFHLRLSVGVASGKNTPLSRSVLEGIDTRNGQIMYALTSSLRMSPFWHQRWRLLSYSSLEIRELSFQHSARILTAQAQDLVRTTWFRERNFLDDGL